MGSGPVTAEEAGARGLTALERERVSPSEANPIRPRDAKMSVASLPKVVKPATDGEATTMSTRRALRGGWGGRARTDASRNLGDPARGWNPTSWPKT